MVAVEHDDGLLWLLLVLVNVVDVVVVVVVVVVFTRFLVLLDNAAVPAQRIGLVLLAAVEMVLNPRDATCTLGRRLRLAPLLLLLLLLLVRILVAGLVVPTKLVGLALLMQRRDLLMRLFETLRHAAKGDRRELRNSSTQPLRDVSLHLRDRGAESLD